MSFYLAKMKVFPNSFEIYKSNASTADTSWVFPNIDVIMPNIFENPNPSLYRKSESLKSNEKRGKKI
jgi:hypothetical protein